MCVRDDGGVLSKDANFLLLVQSGKESQVTKAQILEVNNIMKKKTWKNNLLMKNVKMQYLLAPKTQYYKTQNSSFLHPEECLLLEKTDGTKWIFCSFRYFLVVQKKKRFCLITCLKPA